MLDNAKLVQEAGTIACPILMFVSDGKQVSSGWLEHAQAFAEQAKAKVVHLNCGLYIHYYEILNHILISLNLYNIILWCLVRKISA